MKVRFEISERTTEGGAVIAYRLDRSSGVPAYLQIIQLTEQALRLGTLREGDKLPTAKEVVAGIGVNPNTVLKAYRELENRGLVQARRGVGTFVIRSLARHPAEPDDSLRADLARWMGLATAAGLDREEVRALFSDVLESEGPPQAGAATPRAHTAEPRTAPQETT